MAATVTSVSPTNPASDQPASDMPKSTALASAQSPLPAKNAWRDLGQRKVLEHRAETGSARQGFGQVLQPHMPGGNAGTDQRDDHAANPKLRPAGRGERHAASTATSASRKKITR